MTIKTRISLVSLICLLISGAAHSAGFDNSVVGLRGASMASAYQGIADDGSAIYYNPAGLALIEGGQWNVEASVWLGFTNYSYTAPSLDPTDMGAAHENNSDELAVVPGFFASKTTEKLGLGRLGFGLGFYVPYGGGGVSYGNFMKSQTKLEASLGMFGLSAAVAYELVEKYLAIGITPSVYFGIMKNLSTQQVAMDPTQPDQVVPAEFDANYSGYAGFGGSLGLMSQPIPELTIGITVRSPVQVKMDGEVTTTMPSPLPKSKSDSQVEFLLPMYLELGFGIRPVQGLTLGVSAALIFHGMMDEMVIKTELPTGGTQKTKTKTEYHHGVYVALGAEYMFIKQFGVRAGIRFIQTPTDDGDPTDTDGLTPASIDVHQLFPSLGVVWNIIEYLALDVTCQYGIGLEREEKNAGVTFKYDSDPIILLAGLRFHY